jgi:hypothetical protein
MAGMDFATSLNEISQLGMEIHVFGVHAPTSERVDGLVNRNEQATRKLRFLRALVPAVYTGDKLKAFREWLPATGYVDPAFAG